MRLLLLLLLLVVVVVFKKSISVQGFRHVAWLSFRHVASLSHLTVLFYVAIRNNFVGGLKLPGERLRVWVCECERRPVWRGSSFSRDTWGHREGQTPFLRPQTPLCGERNAHLSGRCSDCSAFTSTAVLRANHVNVVFKQPSGPLYPDGCFWPAHVLN